MSRPVYFKAISFHIRAGVNLLLIWDPFRFNHIVRTPTSIVFDIKALKLAFGPQADSQDMDNIEPASSWNANRQRVGHYPKACSNAYDHEGNFEGNYMPT